MEWELNDLWTSTNILDKVKSICVCIAQGDKTRSFTADNLYQKITRPHCILFKSRKFITRNLLFTSISAFAVGMFLSMLYYYVGSSTILLKESIHNSVILTLEIIIISSFLNGLRNNMAFFAPNANEYKEVYELDGRFYDNFIEIDNIDFLLDGHDIHDTAKRVCDFRDIVGKDIIPYSRMRVYTRVIRPYTLRNIDTSDSSVLKIMNLTKDTRLAHETKDKIIESAKDVMASLG